MFKHKKLQDRSALEHGIDIGRGSVWLSPDAGPVRQVKGEMNGRGDQVQEAVQPMAFGDRDDRGSVEAHLRAEKHAKEMRQFNKRMKKLDAEDARKRGGMAHGMIQERGRRAA